VVWKLGRSLRRAVGRPSLRENHSGMETYEIAESTGGGIGCVRTIVVWKHNTLSNSFFSLFGLRENHSGMETLNGF